MKSARATATLTDSAQHNLRMYALAAGAAGVSVLALTQPSEAKIVYTSAHKRLPINQNFFLDLNHDGVKDFVFDDIVSNGNSRQPSFAAITAEGWETGAEVVGKVASFRAFPYALRAGSSIGPNRPFVSDRPGSMAGVEYVYYGFWANKGKGLRNRYLGLKFLISGKVHYGWARWNVRVYHNKNGKLIANALLTGYAYETVPNKPIIAGQTQASPLSPVKAKPIPPTLGLLAKGWPALSLWRRKADALAPST